MPRTRPPYPPEFRREAVSLVHASEEEHPISKIARKLGVTEVSLSTLYTFIGTTSY